MYFGNFLPKLLITATVWPPTLSRTLLLVQRGSRVGQNLRMRRSSANWGRASASGASSPPPGKREAGECHGACANVAGELGWWVMSGVRMSRQTLRPFVRRRGESGRHLLGSLRALPVLGRLQRRGVPPDLALCVRLCSSGVCLLPSAKQLPLGCRGWGGVGDGDGTGKGGAGGRARN